MRLSSRQSLGMKGPPGFQPAALHHRVAALDDVDAGLGLELRRHQPSVPPRSASAASASSEARARASQVRAAHGPAVVEHLLEPLLAGQRPLLPCDRALSSKAFSSGVMKRSAFFSVWRRR